MNTSAFDRISKLFANRKLSRRQALATGGATLATFAPAVAQEATPEMEEKESWDGEKTTYLFVQSFQSGSIMPTEGQDGRYTVTLEQGTDQTIYFADRPSRDVGAAATPAFLQTLGFSDDNPPNAALILETAPGENDVAVVELFNPTYDLGTQRVTYDVEVLENWQQALEMGLAEDPTDLAALAPTFGAAHLLIDDCPDGCTEQQAQGIFDCPEHGTVSCIDVSRGWFDGTVVGEYHDIDHCGNFGVCMPCEPYGHTQPDRCATQRYWTDKCNHDFAACKRMCLSHFEPLFADCV